MHRSWEEGAGREQVRRGGGAGREGGASSEGQQGSSRDQGQERKREKLGLGAGQGQGGTRRGGDLGRSREGGSNAPSLLLPPSSPFLPFSSLLLPPRLPPPSPAPSPLLLPSLLLAQSSLLSPFPLLCSSPAPILAPPSFSFALRFFHRRHSFYAPPPLPSPTIPSPNHYTFSVHGATFNAFWLRLFDAGARQRGSTHGILRGLGERYMISMA